MANSSNNSGAESSESDVGSKNLDDLLNCFYESLVEQLRSNEKIVVLSATDSSDKKKENHFVTKRLAASWWLVKKIPLLAFGNLYVCFALIFLVWSFFLVYYLTKFSVCDFLRSILHPYPLVVWGIVSVSILIVAFIFIRIFYPTKKKIIVFLKDSNSNKNVSHVLTLSIKEIKGKYYKPINCLLRLIRNKSNCSDGSNGRPEKVTVVIDQFTARKLGSNGLKQVGDLLGNLRNSINAAMREAKLPFNRALIQYHVVSNYLSYRYFFLMKKNLGVCPEPEIPSKCVFKLKMLYTVDITSCPQSRCQLS